MTKSSARRILITGVSRGLGLAMTEGFIERGHTVLGCARSESAVRALAKRFGPPHSFAAVDVSRDDEVRDWARRALKEFGTPDLLVNNAALMNRNAPLWELSADEFDPVIQVNICGVTNVIRHFTPAMIEAGRGVIVNFSSGWGRSTSPEVAPYCTTKWAIEGLTQALAEELPDGMAAVPLNPGIIDTDMLRSAWGDEAGSYPDPSEWAKRAVPYLLSLGPKDSGRPLSVPG